MNGKVMVVGDLMIDRYVIGKASRISPEAPVPVINVTDGYDRPGGAANVANNLVCNGVRVALAGVVGRDDDGNKLTGLLDASGIYCGCVVSDAGRVTTVKCRCVAQNNQQMLRLDYEKTSGIPDIVVNELLKKIEDEIDGCGVVILSDYLKGVLTPDFTQKVIALANARHIPVIADIKDKNYIKYSYAFLLKPNEHELRTIMEVKGDDLAAAAGQLRKTAGVRWVLTTLGASGMMLTGEKGTEFVRSVAKEVYDVTGAGDTVIAFVAMALMRGKEMPEAVRFANDAAGVKVSKLGSAPVMEYEVTAVRCGAGKKVLSREDLRNIPRAGRKIVFTNGCFDVLHIGHISSLRAAKALGDILVVGLNSDGSVKRLKGDSRPYNKEADRAQLLASLECVDYVCVFDEDTPLALIEAVRPDILVKGKDYEDKPIAGREFVESYGGRVALVDLVDGVSSSRLIEKMGEKA